MKAAAFFVNKTINKGSNLIFLELVSYRPFQAMSRPLYSKKVIANVSLCVCLCVVSYLSFLLRVCQFFHVSQVI